VILREKFEVASLLMTLRASPTTGPVLAVTVNSAQERLDLVRKLLDHHADPNACLPGWASPLHYAAWYGHIDTMLALIGAGADPTAIAQRGACRGMTPRRAAIVQGQKDAAFLLESCDAVPYVHRPVVVNVPEPELPHGNLSGTGGLTLDQQDGMVKWSRRCGEE
jgi:hypothetical protein